jgi:hypothetical protein
MRPTIGQHHASTTANIHRPLALRSAPPETDKVYDGTTSATVTLSDNRVAGRYPDYQLTPPATFASKNAGAAKGVSVSAASPVTGVGLGQLHCNTSASATANITARSLSVTATGINKPYDGTTSATVTLADNRLAGDSLSATYTTASFANKNVGTTKTVSVSGIALSGTDEATTPPTLPPAPLPTLRLAP